MVQVIMGQCPPHANAYRLICGAKMVFNFTEALDIERQEEIRIYTEKPLY